MSDKKSFDIGADVTVTSDATGEKKTNLRIAPPPVPKKIIFDGKESKSFLVMNCNNEKYILSCRVDVPQSLFVLIGMTNYLNSSNNLCVCTQKNIADSTGISTANVSRAITHLIAVDIVREYKSKKENGFIIDPNFIFAGTQYYSIKRWKEAGKQKESKAAEKSKKVISMTDRHGADKVIDAIKAKKAKKFQAVASLPVIEDAAGLDSAVC